MRIQRAILGSVCLLLASGTPVRPAPPVRPALVCDTELPLEERLATSPSVDRDLAAIREEGVLRVGLAADPTTWFLDQKRFRGLEHDLVRAFARAQRLRLQLVPLATAHERLEALRSGDVDLVAGRLEVPDHAEVAGVPVVDTRWVLVRPADATSGPDGAPHDLQQVLFIEGTVPAERLVERFPEVELRSLADGTLLEEALELVRAGHGALVAREALVRPLLRRDLVVGAEIGPGSTSLVHRNRSSALGEHLRSWLAAEAETLARLEARYLERRYRPQRVISDFDEHFRREAGRIGWSWSLLASVAWQESRFRPDALSVAGAQGLMQIMPGTADLLGLEDPYEPSAAIRAGARYLGQLDRRWQARIPDTEERLAFVLASYNAGPGHVEDAVALAQAAGQDGSRWEDVAPWMLALADRTWNRHPSVRYGYCRGEEPVAYVESILGRWRAYEATLLARTPDVSLW